MTTAPDRLFAEMRGRMTAALTACPGLTIAELKVAQAMLAHVSRTDFEKCSQLICWPSEQRLACLTGLKENSVRKARAKLRDKGIVTVSAKGGHGPRDTAVYIFSDTWASAIVAGVEQKLAETRANKRTPKATKGRKRGDHRHPLHFPGKGVTTVTKRGDHHHPIRGDHRHPESSESESKKESKTRARDFFDSGKGKGAAPTVGDSPADDGGPNGASRCRPAPCRPAG
jgi:hypothetical protein